jgi:hypothetical protein
LSYGEVEALLHEAAPAALERPQRPSPQAHISGLLDRARQARAHRSIVAVAGHAESSACRRGAAGAALAALGARARHRLHVREDAVQKHAQLIERLRQISRS